jgi:hypothetical protein
VGEHAARGVGFGNVRAFGRFRQASTAAITDRLPRCADLLLLALALLFIGAMNPVILRLSTFQRVVRIEDLLMSLVLVKDGAY